MKRRRIESVRRSIHTIVTDETHAAFKTACVQQRLTMQDYLEECITRLLDGDPYFTKFAEDISGRKRDKTIKRVTNTDADYVYRAINGA